MIIYALNLKTLSLGYGITALLSEEAFYYFEHLPFKKNDNNASGKCRITFITLISGIICCFNCGGETNMSRK